MNPIHFYCDEQYDTARKQICIFSNNFCSLLVKIYTRALTNRQKIIKEKTNPIIFLVQQEVS
jgi:hypothetical protein